MADNTKIANRPKHYFSFTIQDLRNENKDTYKPKNNKGNLHKNIYKDVDNPNDNTPSYKGLITVDGKTLEIAAWLNEYDEKKKEPKPEPKKDDLDEEIPF